MAELLGTHGYQLDPKGRVSLPSKFRAVFVDGCRVTVGQDRCLYVFPRAEWERRAAEVDGFPLSNTDARAFARIFFGDAEEAKLDSQGRLTIPGRLRERVGIDKEVVVLGVRDRMEIWDRENYEAYLAGFADAYQDGSLDPRKD